MGMPPILKNIIKVHKGEVVNAKAYPICGSISVRCRPSAGKNRCYYCSHCIQHFKKEELIRYGERPVLKINKKHEVLP